jgi:hypothetical protein
MVVWLGAWDGWFDKERVMTRGRREGESERERERKTVREREKGCERHSLCGDTFWVRRR